MTSKNKKILASILIVLFLMIGIIFVFIVQMANKIPQVNYAKNIEEINTNNLAEVKELLKVK